MNKQDNMIQVSVTDECYYNKSTEVSLSESESYDLRITGDVFSSDDGEFSITVDADELIDALKRLGFIEE